MTTKKLGTFFKTSSIQNKRSFDKDGFTVHEGYLRITRNFTNMISGTVEQEDIQTKIMGFSPYDLASLKKLLNKHFDGRYYQWKRDTPKKGELGE